MKLAAQRVQQNGTGLVAVHSFLFQHGFIWAGAPPPGLGNGQLVQSHVILRGGGNLVLTYLDIVAPDDTPSVTIRNAFRQISDFVPPPFDINVGSCRFTAGMVPAYRHIWRAELVHLYQAAIGLRDSSMRPAS